MKEEFEKQKKKLIENYDIMLETCQLNYESDPEYWLGMHAKLNCLKTLAQLTL